ncbi:MAG: alpha/beta hydrolase domain-containing protein [Gordonia sp. (in: high G+C Gram-positive bacteria)]
MRFTELSGGNGCSILSATPGPDLAAAGYDETEYAVSGSVTGHSRAGPVDAAAFTTRVVVRRPLAAAAFNGTLVVEWHNVSSGVDAAPEYTYLAAELVRAGYAYAGVSAQYTGVVGGAGSVEIETGRGGPADQDPERYGALHHPGDAYCHDIFAAVGRALAESGSDDAHPLAGLRVRHRIAVGESQSAMALTTHVNEFAEVHGVFDGYLIHSRCAGALPLGEVGTGIDVSAAFDVPPTPIRDVGIPVLTVQTETDILTNFRYHLARQPDTDRVRTWEVAGSAHADHVQIGPYEDYLGCPQPVNRGQVQFVLRAALSRLRGWVVGDATPPTAAPLQLTAGGTGPAFVVDDIGNVCGGVRTPSVDAPTQVLSGVVAEPVSRICLLFGSTLPVAADILAARYGTRATYLERYRAAADRAIDAGFVLPADRDLLLADAHPELVPE